MDLVLWVIFWVLCSILCIPYTSSHRTVFDSSVERGTPFSFKLGAGQVIKGWDQGLLNMCIGEKRKLKIPASMGYGALQCDGCVNHQRCTCINTFQPPQVSMAAPPRSLVVQPSSLVRRLFAVRTHITK